MSDAQVQRVQQLLSEILGDPSLRIPEAWFERNAAVQGAPYNHRENPQRAHMLDLLQRLREAEPSLPAEAPPVPHTLNPDEIPLGKEEEDDYVVFADTHAPAQATQARSAAPGNANRDEIPLDDE